jgi:hypothetical protein
MQNPSSHLLPPLLPATYRLACDLTTRSFAFLQLTPFR